MDETDKVNEKQRVDELSERLVAEGIDHETVRYRDGWVVTMRTPSGLTSEYRLQPVGDGDDRWARWYVGSTTAPFVQDFLSEDALVADLLRQLGVH